MSLSRCDMCQCVIDLRHDTNFVVRMEKYPAPLESGAAIDNDRDYLEDIHEVLERFEEFEPDGELPEEDTYRQRSFKLCSECCERFWQEPLGRRSARHLDFSKR